MCVLLRGMMKQVGVILGLPFCIRVQFLQCWSCMYDSSLCVLYFAFKEHGRAAVALDFKFFLDPSVTAVSV